MSFSPAARYEPAGQDVIIGLLLPVCQCHLSNTLSSACILIGYTIFFGYTDVPGYSDTVYSDTPHIVTLWAGPKSFINEVSG